MVVAEKDVQSVGVEKEIKKVQIAIGDGKRVPQHLRELFEETSRGLGHDQKHQIKYCSGNTKMCLARGA